MTTVRNGWDKWYDQWRERYGADDDGSTPVIPYDQLALWGERFRQLVMLNDHWMGYFQTRPMSLEDGMSIGYVLFDSGVDVEELLDLMDAFQPLEGAIVRVGIPLCWLTDPMDHVQDLLGMLADLPNLETGMLEQMQQTLEEMLGDVPTSSEEWPDLFRTMAANTVNWLLEIMDLLSDHGRVALRAWWQGRLVTLLRETSTEHKRGRRRRK
jgi:hypothetical protein